MKKLFNSYKITIENDPNPVNPLELTDAPVTMKYNIPFFNEDEWKENNPKSSIKVLEFVHGKGTSFIYGDAKELALWANCESTKEEWEAISKNVLEGLYDELKAFYNGETYGFTVETVLLDDDGNELEAEYVDSCYGFMENNIYTVGVMIEYMPTGVFDKDALIDKIWKGYIHTDVYYMDAWDE